MRRHCHHGNSYIWWLLNAFTLLTCSTTQWNVLLFISVKFWDLIRHVKSTSLNFRKTAGSHLILGAIRHGLIVRTKSLLFKARLMLFEIHLSRKNVPTYLQMNNWWRYSENRGCLHKCGTQMSIKKNSYNSQAFPT